MKPEQLVEYLTRMSSREAARLVLVGTATRPTTTITGEHLHPRYRAIAAALTAGVLDVSAAASIIRRLDEARTHHPAGDDLDAAEQHLVADAEHLPADLIAGHAIAWRDALDPDGAEPRGEALRQRRAFHLHRERNGMTPFSGVMPPEDAALYRAALAAGGNPRAEPMFLSDSDRADDTCTITDDNGEMITTLVDPRARTQRDYDVFRGIFLAGVRTGHTGTTTDNGTPKLRPSPTVNVTITWQEFHTGTGTGRLDDVLEPVSATTVQKIACDAGYRKVILGDHGEILHYGKLERYFTTHQRKALAVRDGGCVWPACTAPPAWCDAHHILEYDKDNGPTDIDNGASR